MSCAMYPRDLRRFVFALGVAAALLPAPQAVRAEPYEETAKTHSWFSLSRPHAKNPADQLAFANELFAQGRLRKAGKQYRALAVTWPGSAEAPEAQIGYAHCLDARGKREDAFDQYQVLMEKFVGRSTNYDAVLSRQFEIAVAIGEHRRMAWFGLSGFAAPERSIPFLEKIIQSGPQWEHAADAQLLIGKAYEDSHQEDLAVASYLLCEERYPGTDWARQSALGRARCWYRLSEEGPNDEATLEEAYAASTIFLRRYPNSADTDKVQAFQATLLSRRGNMAYQRAVFYDRVARKPDAALHSYQSFVRSFPTSDHIAEANDRIRALDTKKEPAHEPSK